jgi:hypothetical protein
MSVSRESCVLSGSVLCVGLQSLMCLNECKLETLIMRKLWSTRGCCVTGGGKTILRMVDFPPPFTMLSAEVSLCFRTLFRSITDTITT